MNHIPQNIFKSSYSLVDKVPADKLGFFWKELAVRTQSVSSAYEKIAYEKTHSWEFTIPHPKFNNNSVLYMFALLGCKSQAESLLKVINTTNTLKNNKNLKEIKKELNNTILYVMDDYTKLATYPGRIQDLFNTTLYTPSFYESLQYFLEKDKHVGTYLLRGIKVGELMINSKNKEKGERNYLRIYKDELQEIFGTADNFIALREKYSYAKIKAYVTYAQPSRQANFGNFSKYHQKSKNIQNILSSILEKFGNNIMEKENFNSKYGFKNLNEK